MSNITIHPSIMHWFIVHRKLPTNKILSLIGCFIPSMCSLSNKQYESSFHMLTHCTFVVYLLNWLYSIIHQKSPPIHLGLYLGFVIEGGIHPTPPPPPKCRLVVIFIVVSIINSIWNYRNSVRFKYQKLTLNFIFSRIIANVYLSINHTNLQQGPPLHNFVSLSF